MQVLGTSLIGPIAFLDSGGPFDYSSAAENLADDAVSEQTAPPRLRWPLYNSVDQSEAVCILRQTCVGGADRSGQRQEPNCCRRVGPQRAEDFGSRA